MSGERKEETVKDLFSKQVLILNIISYYKNKPNFVTEIIVLIKQDGLKMVTDITKIFIFLLKRQPCLLRIVPF